MPLESIPPPSPCGKLHREPPHHCNPLVPCIICLLDIGKHYHIFPKGTFCVCYSPPAVPSATLRSFIAHPFTWSWATKAGPNVGKTFSVPTISIACKKDASRAIQWIVSLFHSFKSHLNPEALDPEMGQVLPAFVKLYQSNMLLHFCSQLKNPFSSAPKAATHSTPPHSSAPPSPDLRREIVELHAELNSLKAQLFSLLLSQEVSPTPFS